MKNKLMKRPIMGGTVRQWVDNDMLCLTDLARIYEAERIKNNWVKKRLDHFFNNASDIEYIIELLDLQGVFINVNKSTFMSHAENQGIIKALKSIGQYKVTGRGENKAVFCNPYIFVAVAQWLNHGFKTQTEALVYDTLILNIIETGGEFTHLCTVIRKYITPLMSEQAQKSIYTDFANLINLKVFGKDYEKLKLIASKEQLQQVDRLQIKLSALIDFGSITSYQQAKDYLEL